MLRQLESNLWVDEVPFKLLGIDFGNRMSCIKLSDQSLWLHSPTRFCIDTYKEISNHGQIKYLITPSLMHNLFVMKWKKHCPQVSLMAPSRAKKVEADIKLDQTPINEINAIFNDEISCIPIAGIPVVQEYAFIHHASKTLILTDLAFNFSSEVSGWGRIFLTLYGAYNKFGPTLTIRALIKDKRAFGQSLEQILQHDFDRIIISHGRIVETEAKRHFIYAFRKYLS